MAWIAVKRQSYADVELRYSPSRREWTATVHVGWTVRELSASSLEEMMQKLEENGIT